MTLLQPDVQSKSNKTPVTLADYGSLAFCLSFIVYQVSRNAANYCKRTCIVGLHLLN